MTALVAVWLSAAWVAASAPPPQERGNLLQYEDAAGRTRQVRRPKQWAARRAAILNAMQQVMGELPPAYAGPLDVRTFDEVDRGRYLCRRIAYVAEEGDRVPAFLLIPKGLTARAPGVLCLHPTTELGKRQVVGPGNLPNRQYGAELAERGFVCIAPDYPGYGDYHPDAYGMGYASATMKGVVNHRRAIDVLQSLPQVDPESIGAIGHSLGGHNALFVAAFDERVRAVVTSCGFNSFAKYYAGDLRGWSHDGYMPRIAERYGCDPARMPFDFTEVLAAVAPRAVFVSAPLHDDNFEVSGVHDCLSAAGPVYALLGAPAALEAIHPDCGHDFPPEAREAAYAFLTRVLAPAKE